MTMIASDGHSFAPYTVDMFNIFSGERYDFVLYADKEENLRSVFFLFFFGLTFMEILRTLQHYNHLS